MSVSSLAPHAIRAAPAVVGARVLGGSMTTMSSWYGAPTVSSSLKMRNKKFSQPLPNSLKHPVLVPKPIDDLHCPHCKNNIVVGIFVDHVAKCPRITKIRVLTTPSPLSSKSKPVPSLEASKSSAATHSVASAGNGVAEIDSTAAAAAAETEAEQTEEYVLEQDEKVAVSLTRELEMKYMLTECQAGALKYVQSMAAQLSEAAKPNLAIRCQKLGYSAAELEQTLRFIRLTAPIIVHIDLDAVLEPLSNDRYLRNQFETKTSKGILDENHRSRIAWEHNIFKGLYDHAQGYERPKYGSINITNDPGGVFQCRMYGDCYLLLRNVRFRTTFCSCDSSENLSVNDMATCEHYAHVLNQYEDVELAALMDVANHQTPFLSSEQHVKTYKEAQIAGPIRLDLDVEAIVVNPRHALVPGRIEKLQQFAKRNNCTLLWIVFQN
jgi:Protein of unknown function (DUF3626)